MDSKNQDDLLKSGPIKHDKQEIKAQSQVQLELEEEKLLKRREKDGWQLTGITNPLPYHCIYYFLKDTTQKA